LILSNNLIREIGTNLVPLKKLQHLDLSNNQIDMSNIININVLKENTGLMSLLLFGNSNYNFEKVKYICLENLKKVNFLDAVKIISVPKQNKSKKALKSYVTVKGIKGNKKNIATLNEYIKFKYEDFKNNTKDYEDNFKFTEDNKNDNDKNIEKSSHYFANDFHL
jgi:hypothetical protein